MDLTKSFNFFNPSEIGARCHIVGCGSVGSTIAENLVRCGVTKISLYDFDTVEPRNIANQMFRAKDIGRPKVDALRDLLVEINPDCESEIRTYADGWKNEILNGYVFLAVDSIETRREFVERHKYAAGIVRAVFDIRTTLTGFQMYAARWDDAKQRENLLASMQFSHEEAMEATPVSACGVTLGVATTVRLSGAFCVNNFMQFVKDKKLWKFAFVDGFSQVFQFAS